MTTEKRGGGNDRKEGFMSKQGVPKKNASGRGRRANRGRGGCAVTRKSGRGR